VLGGGRPGAIFYRVIVRKQSPVSQKRPSGVFPKLPGPRVSLASMATKTGRFGLATTVTLGVATIMALTGCAAASEPNAILRIGSRNLRCPQSDLEMALHRESNQTAEYYVGCDFIYTRVLCDKPHGADHPTAECHPARPQPPCFAGGCFKENPQTFEWELDETLASNAPVSDGRELFASPASK
jgi:hypothetical protein